MTNVSEQKKPSRKRLALLVGGVLLLVILISAATVFFMQMQQRSKDDTKSDLKATSERIIKKVSELYLVPGNEAPTVAKLQNKDSLQDNREFYENAQNGDYVLVYQQAKTAMLYRESIHKLVKVSPISAGEASR